MITWRLNQLIAEYKDNYGKMTYREISHATGLSTSILTTIAKNKVRRADLKTIDMLLLFFSWKLGRKLQTQDLLEFTDDRPSVQTTKLHIKPHARVPMPDIDAPTPEKEQAVKDRRAALLAQASNVMLRQERANMLGDGEGQ